MKIMKYNVGWGVPWIDYIFDKKWGGGCENRVRMKNNSHALSKDSVDGKTGKI